MPQFTDVPVSDAAATTLLTEYFGERARSFPVAQGSYRPTFPTPEQFLPPRGVFILVSDAPGKEPDENAGEDGGEHGRSPVFVGCGGIRRIEDSPAGAVRFEVKHLWLRPAARGRGWGRVLLSELERRAKVLGADEVVLDTNASLAAAGALYLSAGYAEIPPYNDNPNATNWYRKALT